MAAALVWFGCLVACVGAASQGVADLVLSCSLMEERGGMGGGAPFSQTPATLILRDVAVAADDSLETLSPFVPPSVPDPDAILFETRASPPEIPNADVLLHADCNEQEVMCEISAYFPHDSEGGSGPAYFMVSVTVDAVDFSTMLILRTSALEKDQSTLIQSKLALPLTRSGTLLTEVVFLVFSLAKSVSAPLRGDALLNCGFRHPETIPVEEVSVEWRLQHRGKGQRVLEMRARPADLEGSTVVHSERGDSSMDAAQVVGEGNASMMMTKLKVKDEGTYICTVGVGLFRAQQVIQLQLKQPPGVSLPEKLVLPSQTLSCHCSQYYPLDAQMEWSSLSPADTEPAVLADQGALSSHQQHGDGTYSLSSRLTLPADISPGTKITCTVSHPALEAPLSVSVVVESPEPDRYWWFLGFLVITALFFYQVIK